MAPKTRPSWRQNYTPRPMPSTPLSTSFPVSSTSCSKLISLLDWWLIKSETVVNGNRLAVGGFHYSCEEKTMHIFTSALVVKTFDPYTIETADGSILRLQGGINRLRMEQNGFPPEVSLCFFIGFPYNWEYYAKKDYGPIIPNSATFPRSSVIGNEGTFPVPVAFEFPLVKLFNDCASNPESSVDDLLIKNLTSSPVNAELHNTLSISNDSVQSENISASEKDSDDVERCPQHERHELHNGVNCEHLISSSLNVNFDSQNESRQMLQIEHLSNKESEINCENLCFENTFNSVKSTDGFLNALSREVLKSLHTQQEVNSASKDPEVITAKMSSALEASSESPQACAQRNTDTEINPSSGAIPMHDGVGCKHLISSSSNVKCNNQNESRQMLSIESLCNKGAEINNNKLSFENTSDSVNSSDDFSNTLSPEDLKSLHTQQKNNSANKDSELITTKKSLTLEASFDSPQAYAQRHTGTESYSTSLSPFARSILEHITKRKRRGSNINLQYRAQRIIVNPQNDGSDVLGSTFNENTDILPLNAKESTENDTKTLSANASPVRKDNSDCDVGRAQRCYMLRSRDAKMEINSPNCEKNLKSKPLNLSKIEVIKESKVSKLRKASNLAEVIKKKSKVSKLKKARNQAEVIKESKVSKLKKERNPAEVIKKESKVSKLKKARNQAEVIKESKVSKLTKARNQVPVQRPNISEVMKSPLTRKIGKQKAILSMSPELHDPKRSISGRLLLAPIDRSKREVVYNMEGSITGIADVDKFSSFRG